MKFDKKSLEDFARGAAFLGTGGGGDPYIGRLLAQQAIAEYGAPEIIDADSLDDDALILPIAMLGAPTVLAEKAACGDDIDLALKRLSEELGRKPDALIPIEIGGINSTLPIMAAARAGLPLVNADGMGRAFPEIQMVSFNVYGCSATPLAVVDEHMNSVIVRASSAQKAESLVRAIAVSMGMSVMISCYPLSGKQVKAYAVKNTLSLATGIGQAIADGRKTGSPIEALLGFLKTTEYYRHCKVLFDGKITDLRRETTRGFSIGHCIMTELNGSGREMSVEFQNENLVARIDGTVCAIVPDLICIVDRETAEPLPTEALKYGQRVKVIGASVPPIMRTPEALNVFGPQAFGINEPFTPIEEFK
ncbi:DUF917 domain-containing protein [Kordiimonas pumila]|uniref:DUF917 domain-containing protein n=1 Tax=Kordiimonas pumila TaxID=2161677 RepID=A0ABV7D4K4_9PROT|nr:DUF917 domain-containing protein [Kordiimonas pumila]